MINVHESFESAETDTVDKFGSRSFLIREVGASTVTYPTGTIQTDAQKCLSESADFPTTRFI